MYAIVLLTNKIMVVPYTRCHLWKLTIINKYRHSVGISDTASGKRGYFIIFLRKIFVRGNTLLKTQLNNVFGPSQFEFTTFYVQPFGHRHNCSAKSSTSFFPLPPVRPALRLCRVFYITKLRNGIWWCGGVTPTGLWVSHNFSAPIFEL